MCVVGTLYLPCRSPILQPLEPLGLHRISVICLTTRSCASGGIPVPATNCLVPTAPGRNKEAFPSHRQSCHHRPGHYHRTHIERLRRRRLCRCDRWHELHGSHFEPTQSC